MNLLSIMKSVKTFEINLKPLRQLRKLSFAFFLMSLNLLNGLGEKECLHHFE